MNGIINMMQNDSCVNSINIQWQDGRGVWPMNTQRNKYALQCQEREVTCWKGSMWLFTVYTVCRNIDIKTSQQAVVQSSHHPLTYTATHSSAVAVCDKIYIRVSYAGIIWTNCLDKVSNVEQLDVLNGPVMTAEHAGHMDGPHWDLTVGKGPNTLISSEREKADDWRKSTEQGIVG